MLQQLIKDDTLEADWLLQPREDYLGVCRALDLGRSRCRHVVSLPQRNNEDKNKTHQEWRCVTDGAHISSNESACGEHDGSTRHFVFRSGTSPPQVSSWDLDSMLSTGSMESFAKVDWMNWCRKRHPIDHE